MRAFHKTIAAGAVLGLFFTFGCDSSTDSNASATAVGTWKGLVADSTLSMVVKSDLTFTAVLPDQFGTYLMSGTYTFDGKTITLQYASSLQGAEGIPPPPINPATGTISGTSMKIPSPYKSEGDSTTLKRQ
jgi:hypothetical protein